MSARKSSGVSPTFVDNTVSYSFSEKYRTVRSNNENVEEK